MKRVNLFGRCTVKVSNETFDGVVWTRNGFRDKNEAMWVYRRVMHREYPVLVDVGAGSGAYTLIASIHKTLQVVAIEPVESVRDVLVRNVELNKLEDRVSIHSFAAWHKDDTGLIKVPNDKTLSTLGEPLRFNEFESQGVTLKPIDSLGLELVDIMKIDVEGAELMVLEGAVETIKKHKPFMLIECQDKNTLQFGYKAHVIKNYLEELGATTQKHGRDIMVWWK